MDMKYVTPFLLIAAVYCFQALGIFAVLASQSTPVPSLEMPGAFTRV
jgi:hypothetical protein